MANNKVELSDGTTLMDITDTTATEADVASGKTFYKANGARGVGTGQMVPEIQQSGNWFYRVYDDGTFEAWYKQTSYSITINNQSGNLYRSALVSLALPSEIYTGNTVDIIHAEVNCAHNNYPSWGMVASYYATGVNFYAMSGGSRSMSPNYTLDAYVFGAIS